MLEMGRQNEQMLEARIAERTRRLEEANRLLVATLAEFMQAEVAAHA